MLSEETKAAIKYAMESANKRFGLLSRDDPKHYFKLTITAAKMMGNKQMEAELLANRKEAEQILGGLLGIM